jgi:hypothetical protein
MPNLTLVEPARVAAMAKQNAFDANTLPENSIESLTKAPNVGGKLQPITRRIPRKQSRKRNKQSRKRNKQSRKRKKPSRKRKKQSRKRKKQSRKRKKQSRKRRKSKKHLERDRAGKKAISPDDLLENYELIRCLSVSLAFIFLIKKSSNSEKFILKVLFRKRRDINLQSEYNIHKIMSGEINTATIISPRVITIRNKYISQMRDFFPNIKKDGEKKMSKEDITKLDDKIRDGDDLQYYIMEYLENYDTYKKICGDTDVEVWDDKRCEHITTNVCREADKIHRTRHLHGDLHEQNVMVGIDDSIKIIDWGLAIQNDDANWEQEDEIYGTDWSKKDRGKRHCSS